MDYIQKEYIECRYCHQKAPLKTMPVYDDGFNKVGEKYLCGFCKKEYEKDDIPFVKQKKPEREGRTVDETCDNCDYFVKNIFQQKCTCKDEFVNVYDSCENFVPRKKKKTLP
ncbi:MAG: hypothetical protein JW928_03050 [Candidatus Aureabacteria bacterium]|nr:hypothetical protein [Candidatus Auribacterota bacterium]